MINNHPQLSNSGDLKANSHLKRLQEQAAETKDQKRKTLRMGWIMIAFVLFCFMLFSSFGPVPAIAPKDLDDAVVPDAKVAARSVEPDTEDTAQAIQADAWELILVSSQTVLPKDFTVDLIKFETVRVDYRVAEPLKQMIDAAKADGVTISVCSGYRSVSEQTRLYNNKYLMYLAAGYSDEESAALTSQYSQKGGMSEHHTGLAVDLLTDGVTQLDERFAETSAYAWLKENAAKYGFIERYPKDKNQLTGILWEPWHYRYVGESNAAAMISGNLCLEEYLQNMACEP